MHVKPSGGACAGQIYTWRCNQQHAGKAKGMAWQSLLQENQLVQVREPTMPPRQLAAR